MARFLDSFDRHDLDGVMAAMSLDCLFENAGPAPDGEHYEGADAVRDLWERFFSVIHGLSSKRREKFAAGDRFVVRWRYDCGSGHVRGIDVLPARDGLATEKLRYVKG